jgi:hypothetical protein
MTGAISDLWSMKRRRSAPPWRRLASSGCPGRFLGFLDPWGNHVEIVAYQAVQFTKAPHVLRGMGLAHLSKSKAAIRELADKGMAPDDAHSSRGNLAKGS